MQNAFTIMLLASYPLHTFAVDANRPKPAAPKWVAELAECDGGDYRAHNRMTVEGCSVRRYYSPSNISYYRFDVWWKDEKPICYLRSSRKSVCNNRDGTACGGTPMFDECIAAYHNATQETRRAHVREILRQSQDFELPKPLTAQVTVQKRRSEAPPMPPAAEPSHTGSNAISYLRSGTGIRASCEGTGANFQVINQHSSRAIDVNIKFSYSISLENVTSTFGTRIGPGRTFETCTYVPCVSLTQNCGFYRYYSVIGATFAR